jgi:predicted protein tyrosine phosphatase
MKLLFICNQNQNRSKTAEILFKDKYETKSAGLYNQNPVKESDLVWADIILVMEDAQRLELSKRFPKTYLKKKILDLNIPDTYYFNQDSLKTILSERLIEAM